MYKQGFLPHSCDRQRAIRQLCRTGIKKTRRSDLCAPPRCRKRLLFHGIPSCAVFCHYSIWAETRTRLVLCFLPGPATFIVDHGIEYTFYETYLKNIDTASIDSVYVCGLEIEEYTGMNIIAYLEKHPEYTVYFAPGARILQIRPERMV